MDNLTHSLVGAALARSGLERRTPIATATLVIAANAPDVDVLSYARGQWFALSFRRGITHGVPALIVLPWLVAGVVMAWDRGVRRRRSPDAPPARFGPLLTLSYLGVLTHPVLDWMNTYGMRWWLPFDPSWSYGDSLFIIDPWLWLMLGAAVALASPRTRGASAAWLALAAAASAVVLGTAVVPVPGKIAWIMLVLAAAVAGALGRPITGAGRMRAARGLTTAAAVYIGLMVVFHHAAVADVRSALGSGSLADAQDIMIGPRPAAPLASDVIVQTGDRFLFGAHDWLNTPRARVGVDAALPLLEIDPGVTAQQAVAAVAAAKLRPEVALYLVWSRFPVWKVELMPGGLAVRVGDARYPAPGPLSGPTVIVPGLAGDAR